MHSVSYALTMPEYIETWLRAPAYTSLSILRSDSNYSIQFHGGELPPIAVRGSWLSRRPDYLALTWTRADNIMHLDSQLRMQLQESAGRTMLHLHRCGFRTEKQSLWHGKLWNSSIAGLAELLEFARTDNDRPKACGYAISSLHRHFHSEGKKPEH